MHFNNEIAVDVGSKQILWSLYKSYDLSTHFINDLYVIVYYLMINNIFVDKYDDLSTYLFYKF